MTKEEKYTLARWAVKHATENGAQQAKASIYESVNSSVEVREEKIDKLEQSTQNGMTIYLFVDQKYSAHSTNRLNNREELALFIEKAIEGTRFLAEDEFRSLPETDLYFKGEVKDLGTFDESFLDIDPQEKIKAAFNVEKEVLGTDERIISVSASYYDGMSSAVMVTSNGFEGDRESTYFGLNAQVSVDGGDSRPESYWSESAIGFDELIKKGIGKKALSRGLDKIGQVKISTEKMPMVVENRLVSRLLSPVISALNGSAIQQKNSFLVDKIGEKIGSGKFSLIDDPTIHGGRSSKQFDSEGLVLKKRTVIDKGVLKSYYIDTYYGKKLEMEPTTGSTTNLVLEPGSKGIEEMLASLDKGVLVTGFNGGNTNGSTGDFSYGIEGFLIEKGKKVKPVSEMNITGNIIDLLMNLAETGDDVLTNSSWRMPSVRFDNVAFSGL